ncbi:MAG: histidine kinase, partial [Bacteroidota bacterium]
PHFLFNNLNILSSLIDHNSEQAQDFLGNFSEVYRYVLRQREEELVPLRSELEFLDAYVYMLRQRFRKQVHIEIDIQPSHRALFLPPLALQMLIENAIKHNKATESSPLTITIQSQEGGIYVCNTLQVKRIPPKGTGFGLENLRKRYEFLSMKSLRVEKANDQFCVFLPLLSTEPS